MSGINVNQVGEVLGYAASGVAAATGIGALFLAIKRRWNRRKMQQKAIMDGLKKLCEGQSDIYNRLELMDGARAQARIDDANVRSNLYLGQIAMIAAIREMGKHMGITINGEVQKYYELNIEALRTGMGMTPLHAKPKKAVKTDAVQVDGADALL